MFSFALTILLDGLSYGMVLFLISVGLTITMGLMRVVNLAHGSFAMIGGYVAGYMTQHGMNFFLAVGAAMIVSGLLGAVVETTVYRPLYRKGELAQVLLTIGLVFVATAGVTEVANGINHRHRMAQVLAHAHAPLLFVRTRRPASRVTGRENPHSPRVSICIFSSA